MEETTTSETDGSSIEKENYNKLFALAIRTDKVLEDLIILLRSGKVNLNKLKIKGMRPIHYAAFYNKLELLALLLDTGECDVNALDESGHAPIHVAARKGHSVALAMLIEAGGKLNWQPHDCYIFNNHDSHSFIGISAEDIVEDPLFFALEEEHNACVEIILRKGGQPNVKYFMGEQTSIVSIKNTLGLELLLKSGANPNCFNRWGISPLMRACKESCLDAVLVLLSHEADPDLKSQESYGRKTALYYAMNSERTDVIQLLLNFGANPNQYVQQDVTALEFAVKKNSPTLMCCLLKNNADPNFPNSSQKFKIMPLQFVCSLPNLESRNIFLKLLLDAGANPNFYSDIKDKVSLDIPCLPPLVEYFSCNEDLDPFTVYLLIHYGAKVHLTPGISGYQLLDPYGLQRHITRLLQDPNLSDVVKLVLNNASIVDRKSIRVMHRISLEQKEAIFTLTAPNLTRICRHVIRQNLSVPVPKKVEELPLPNIIKKYLLNDTDLERF